MNWLLNKKILVMGVANQRSIAWAIAKALYKHGAELIFTFQNERLGTKVKRLVEEEMKEALSFQCDVSSDEEIRGLFSQIKDQVGTIDGIVHSIAFAPSADLEADFINTSRKGYAIAQEISAYSLIGVANYSREVLSEEGSILTMTYAGAERVVPDYKVMGVAKASLEASVRYLANDLGSKQIRINGISAGPIRTLSAKGVSNFNSVLQLMREKAPLRRETDVNDVANTAVFLLSPLSRGITGEVIHVDNGFNIVGM